MTDVKEQQSEPELQVFHQDPGIKKLREDELKRLGANNLRVLSAVMDDGTCRVTAYHNVDGKNQFPVVVLGGEAKIVSYTAATGDNKTIEVTSYNETESSPGSTPGVVITTGSKLLNAVLDETTLVQKTKDGFNFGAFAPWDDKNNATHVVIKSLENANWDLNPFINPMQKMKLDRLRQAGSVILKVNGTEVKTIAEFDALLMKLKVGAPKSSVKISFIPGDQAQLGSMKEEEVEISW